MGTTSVFIVGILGIIKIGEEIFCLTNGCREKLKYKYVHTLQECAFSYSWGNNHKMAIAVNTNGRYFS